MMKRKMISAVLAAVMTVGMITGCGSSQTTTENKADKADKLESQTDLSSTDYDFEKEYAYGDFNAHSRADEDRQDGIDTFEDKDIVFQDITYDQLIDILGSEGNYMIQLSGSWCHNSRAMSPFINKYAKEYGYKFLNIGSFTNVSPVDGEHLATESHKMVAERLCEIIKSM